MKTSARSLALALALLSIVLPATPAMAQQGYRFQVLATNPGSAPGIEGGSFINDFEPYGLNNRGEASFVADLTIPSPGEEGVFLAGRNGLTQIARAGEMAPGGGILSFLDMGSAALNDAGDVSFAYALEPFTFPVGSNGGVYRYSHQTGLVTPVLVPGVTPAPGGGTFSGTFYNTSINNRGDIAFTGMVPASIGPGASIGLGMGVFTQDKHGHMASVVRPGDPAPGGSVFDHAIDPSINDAGDVAFDGHIAGDEPLTLGLDFPFYIFYAASVYVRQAQSGQIVSIAHMGQPAPGGGVYRLAFGPIINNRGDLVFIGDLTPPPGFGDALGVFVHADGATFSIARPGDSLPGGGHMTRAAFNTDNFHINNRGDVVFNAVLDTDDNGDGIADTGLYLWSGGQLSLIARTGTVIPSVGTVAHLQPPVAVGDIYPHSGAVINDRGQVLFQVTLSDGTGILLIATPRP